MTHDPNLPTRRRVLTLAGATALASSLHISASVAQQSTKVVTKVVRIIVPFAPGAAVDVVARMLATSLSAQWGRSVIVENRPGARTLIAADAVARSEPDGDTLLFCLDDTFTIVPHLTKKPQVDVNKELVPINLVGTIAMAFVVNPSLPVKTVPELVDYAKAHPTAVSYSSSGVGSAPHLAMEMLKAQAKINMVHVPYRGLAPAQTAIVAGEVQTGILGYGSSRSMTEAGKLRIIAIASPSRVAALPNIPSTHEIGYDRVDATSRLTLAGPAGMSTETLKRVNDAVSRALHEPELRKQIERRDIVVTDMGPKPFGEEIRRLSRLNGEAVKIAHVEAE